MKYSRKIKSILLLLSVAFLLMVYQYQSKRNVVEKRFETHAVPDLIKHDVKNCSDEKSSQEISNITDVLRNNLKELRFSINAILNDAQLSESLKLLSLKTRVNEQLSLSIADADEIASKDAREREIVIEKLSSYVQEQIHAQQNPKTCKRLIRCILPPNGLASALHHAIACLIVGHGTERVVILSTDRIAIYQDSFTSVFKPLSTTCTTIPGNADVVHMHQGVALSNEFYPPVVPNHLLSTLSKYLSYPDVWWSSQFAKYALRTTNKVTQRMTSRESEINLTQTVVGIHIRRGDKISSHEASFHAVEQYMDHVEYWYQEHVDKQLKKRVYVATDDEKVISQLKEKYPNYIFIEGNKNTRRNKEGLYGILQDIFILSKCDFLVCTFSSNVCRLSYELMETYRIDASNRYQSLDDSYYFMSSRKQVVTHKHIAKNSQELDLEIGDVVTIKGNHWDGYSLGLHDRTKKIGLYPSYKARYKINSVTFPIYA